MPGIIFIGGLSGKDFEVFVPGTDILSRSIQDDRTHPSDSWPAGTDPQVLCPQADAVRPNGSELQCSHPMETRHLPSQLSLSGIVRPPHEAHEQRTDAIDCSPAEAFDLAEVPAGAGGGPDPQTIRTSLLELCLGNDAIDCFMKTILIVELWACCMDNTFSWGLTGTWKQPLQRMLTRGPHTQWLTDSDCLGSLFDGWFATHTRGSQHDAAEFLGWLRLTLHRVHYDDVLQAPRWEARFDTTVEDRGMTCSPIVMRDEKPAGCTLQELVRMWHNQAPYCLGFVGSATTVCLQINRFPALGIRSKTMISWNRQHVMLPCFMHASGRTVNWIEYQVVAAALHRGQEPHCGHYQCILRTGGSRFLTDDDRVPIAVPHLQEMEQDIYLVWLTRAADLTVAYRTVVERPNPFVPLYSSR